VAKPTSSAHSHWRRAADQRSDGRMTSPTRTRSRYCDPGFSEERVGSWVGHDA
jgi:hypothetical protein